MNVAAQALPRLWSLVLALMVIIPAVPMYIGARWRNGMIAWCGGGALLLFGIPWILSVSSPMMPGAADWARVLDLASLIVGAALMISGWALALASAARERRWGTFTWLSLAVMLSVGAYFVVNPFYSAPCSPATACFSDTFTPRALTLVAAIAGPVSILFYGVRKPRPTAPNEVNHE